MINTRTAMLFLLMFACVTCEQKEDDGVDAQVAEDATEPVSAEKSNAEEERRLISELDQFDEVDAHGKNKILQLKVNPAGADVALARMQQWLKDRHSRSFEVVEHGVFGDNTQISIVQSKSKTRSPDEEADKLFMEATELLKDSKSKKEKGYQKMYDASAHGHKRAKAMIAFFKMFDYDSEEDIIAAKKIFTEMIKYGVPEAHMGLGFMYATGIGLMANQARALVHYTFASIGNNSWAQMVLGYRFWGGVTVSTDCESALNYYRAVANKVASEVSISGGPVVQRIKLLEETENPNYVPGIVDKNLLDYYQMLADKGDVQAQVGLGQLHYQGGRGVDLDFEKALHYFLNAADAGNPVAVAFLGKIYLEGNEAIPQDNETAFNFFKKAAELENPVGQSGLGLMYLYGRGVPVNYEKAFKYFTLAAEQGWVDGQLHLGIMYFRGIGVKPDYKLAHKYFTLASQSGHVLAFYNLAQMHATGTGVLRTCATATELYKNVAERGRWSSILMDAHADYKNGYSDRAFIKYALLAEMGYEVAQSNAAFLLDRGEVTLWKSNTEQHVRALMYWGRSAYQGYSAAQVKLGDYYYYGLGTAVDYEAAAMHYRVASEQQHNPQAMFNLGYMHEHGLGMEQDMYLAKRFYDLAAETSPDAKIPVALALVKLSLYIWYKYVKEHFSRYSISLGGFSFTEHLSDWVLLLDLEHLFGASWDIYLLTVLCGALVYILFRRR